MILNIISEVIIEVALNKIIINIIIAIEIIIISEEVIIKVIKINSLSYKDFKKRIITLI